MKRISTLFVAGLAMLLINVSCKKVEVPTLYQKYGTLKILGADEFKLMTDDNETLFGSAKGVGDDYTLSDTRFNIVYYIKGDKAQGDIKKEYDVDVVSLLSVNTFKPYYSSDFSSEEQIYQTIGERNMNIYSDTKGGVWFSKNPYSGKTYLNMTVDLRYSTNNKGHKVGFLIDEDQSTENELYILAKHKSPETGVHDNSLIYPVACDLTDKYDLSKYSASNPLTIHLMYYTLIGSKLQRITVTYPGN